MTEPIWLSKDLVIAIHDEQLRTFGGPPGIHDHGLLESALARPQNKYAYGSDDLAELASAYGFGLSRNHAFVDGNKRIAFLAIVPSSVSTISTSSCLKPRRWLSCSQSLLAR